MKKIAPMVCGLALLASVAACGSNDEARPVNANATSSERTTVPSVVTETSTETTTVTASPSSASPHYVGHVDNTDSRGFLSGPARCDRGDLAFLVMRTETGTSKPGSRVVLCHAGGGEVYYRGARDKRGDKGITVEDVFHTRGDWVAQNGEHHYVIGLLEDIGKVGLTISGPGNVVLSEEPEVEYAYVK